MFERIRLICFDLDDTLWPCHEVIRAAEAECYAWLACEAPRLTERYNESQLRDHRIETAHGAAPKGALTPPDPTPSRSAATEEAWHRRVQ